MTVYSLLHVFTFGQDALGFLDLLPAERVAPLHVPVRGALTRPGPGAPPEDGDLDTALFAALALDGRTPYMPTWPSPP